MFAPEPRHQAEQKTEYDLEIHGVLPGCYQLEKEKKKKIKAIYKLILLAHKVLLSSGA